MAFCAVTVSDASMLAHFLLDGASTVFGKAEGRGIDWHGHVTAVTVAPEYRKLGYATQLMKVLEDVSERS